jgi:hypothetical protein
MPKLEAAFGKWKKGDVPATTIPAVGSPGTALIQLINRFNRVTESLALSTLDKKSLRRDKLLAKRQ